MVPTNKQLSKKKRNQLAKLKERQSKKSKGNNNEDDLSHNEGEESVKPSTNIDKDANVQNEEENDKDPEDVITFQCSAKNPFLQSWIHGVSNKIYHPRNKDFIEANMINVMQNKFLINKIPT